MTWKEYDRSVLLHMSGGETGTVDDVEFVRIWPPNVGAEIGGCNSQPSPGRPPTFSC